MNLRNSKGLYSKRLRGYTLKGETGLLNAWAGTVLAFRVSAVREF